MSQKVKVLCKKVFFLVFFKMEIVSTEKQNKTKKTQPKRSELYFTWQTKLKT